MEQNPFQQEYFGQTVLDPLALSAVIVLGLALLWVRRRYAVIPMLTMGCFISPAQRIAVLTVNFDLLRVMLIFGSLRILLNEEWRGFRWNRLDICLALWALWQFVAGMLLFPSLDALKYELGVLYDVLGMYFFFRCLVRDRKDIEQFAKGCVVISVPVALAFLIEFSTGHNMFAALGGVHEVTMIRDGRRRCQGAFAHPILAGCFWASLVPIIALLWWRGSFSRASTVIGVGAACVIVVTCASSTPVMAMLFVVMGACLFRFRRWMRVLRWGLLFTIIALHLVMNAPVWHLISRMDVVSGSTGSHRAFLIDNFIKYADEWWLYGSNVGTAHWGWEQFDVTNLYIVQGLHGGLIQLGLFLAIISLGFQVAGRFSRNSGDISDARLGWALGVSLFSHAMNFLGVSYFGQINMVWYLLLAMIASLSSPKACRVRKALVTAVSDHIGDRRAYRGLTRDDCSGMVSLINKNNDRSVS
jgi:hypothetical protein